VFLKQRDLVEAVEILKSFEKKETTVATAAATNLSFLFYLVSNGEYFNGLISFRHKNIRHVTCILHSTINAYLAVW
jgi:hypothetical protein